MSPVLIVLIVIAVILVAAFIVLTILGKKAQKKKEEQDAQVAAAAQTVTMLIIDKKRMKLKDAGLPQQIMDQTSKFMRRAKLPIVKAKVGPRVMSLIADEQIFDEIPVKKEVKARMQENYNKANARLKEEQAADEERKAQKKAAKAKKKGASK